MDVLSIAQFGLVPALASALLHSLWQNALLGAAAAATLAALARGSAAARHIVAMLYLLAMLLLPALQFLRFWEQPGAEINSGLLPAMTATPLDAATLAFQRQSSPAAALVCALWLSGVLVMLLRHAGGLALIRTLQQRVHVPLPAAWQQRLSELCDALGIARAVSVRLSADVLTPFTARYLRPVIWLPLSWATRAPTEQLEALLAHELAHIARRDWLWNGLQCIVEAVLFFHPAVWWLSRRIREEREHACDDLAVQACGDSIALAEALTSLAQQRHAPPELLLAAKGGALMRRITHLLSGPEKRGRWGARAALGVVLGSGALMLSQVGIAGRSLPHVRIDATTEGVLGPNDIREITAQGLDKKRYYRASVGADGRLIEVYREDDVDRPIDDSVRRWVAEMSRLSMPPAPPAPPAPPGPPPPPPSIADAAEFKALLQLVVADPQVRARTGSPTAVVRDGIDGRMSIDAGNGDAELQFGLQGPNGGVRVSVSAALEAGRWSVERLALSE